MTYAIRVTLNGRRMQSGRTFAKKSTAIAFIKANVPSRMNPSVIRVGGAVRKRRIVRRKTRVTRRRKKR